MNQVVLASGNKGKVRELSALLADMEWEVIPQTQFDVSSVAETGTTFVENAIIKARHAAAETGLPAIADDSGIEIDALQGKPGVYSARFAGENASDEANIQLALEQLKGVPTAERTARFHCVLVFMRHATDPTPLICQGVWEGVILEQLQGENGFGYDPIFYVPTHQCSAAELTAEIKNSLSHRGKALKILQNKLNY